MATLRLLSSFDKAHCNTTSWQLYLQCSISLSASANANAHDPHLAKHRQGWSRDSLNQN